jgi:hypothetical protein
MDKFSLIKFWKEIGTLNEKQSAFKANKMLRIDENKKLQDPLFYNIIFNKNTSDSNWLIITIDIVKKDNKSILIQNKDIINELKKLENIFYMESNQQKGLQILISSHETINLKNISKEIFLNGIRTSLIFEYKNSCFVSPSESFDFIYKNSKLNYLKNNEELNDLVANIISIFEKFKLFDNCKIKLDSNDEIIFEQNYKKNKTEEFLYDRSLVGHKFNEFKSNFTKKNQISFFANMIWNVKLNYSSSYREIEVEQYFKEFLTNFENFANFILKDKKASIYFYDIQLFIQSIICNDILSTENEPFYTLSCTEKWIKWTNEYLNCMEMLKANSVSSSYKADDDFDRHTLYRAITKINEFGSNLTDEESRDELDGFRVKYQKEACFQSNTASEFLNFILSTLSLIQFGSDLRTHFSINKFFIMFSNPKNFNEAGVLTFKRCTKKYNMKILKHSKLSSKESLVYVYFQHLPWYKFDSDFINNILYIIFPNHTNKQLEDLKSEITSLGN